MINADLEVVPHPYEPTEPGRWDNEAWGRFRLSVGADLLIDQQWDLCLFIEWFLSSRDAIRTEELRIDGVSPAPGESLAEFLERAHFFGDDPDNMSGVERIMELINPYEDRHRLSRGFPGTDVWGWLIGRNGGGAEISIAGDKPRAYRLCATDLMAFVNDITIRGIRFLRDWLQQPQPMAGVQRVRRLLKRMESLAPNQ